MGDGLRHSRDFGPSDAGQGRRRSVMRLRLLASLCALLLGLALAAPAQAQKINNQAADCTHANKQVALIITNTIYSGAFARLDSTAKDAEEMRRALCLRDFTVWSIHNASLADMNRARDEFAARIKALGQGAVVFFYYSGHGAVAVEGGENYLIPADALVTRRADIPAASIPVSRLRATLSAAASDAEALIIVLDACRNLAFPGESKANEKGFEQLPTAPGELIAYSTAAGATSRADNTFSQTLGETLQVSDEDVTNMFLTVQEKVFKTIGQQPWLNIGLRERLYLPRGGVPGKPKTVGATDAEAVFWTGCCASAPDAAASLPWLQAYMDRVNRKEFAGRFAMVAREKIEKIRPKATIDCAGKIEAALYECLALTFLERADKRDYGAAWAMIGPPNNQQLTFPILAQMLDNENAARGQVRNRVCARQPSPLPAQSANNRPLFTVSCSTTGEGGIFLEVVSVEQQLDKTWRVFNFIAFPPNR